MARAESILTDLTARMDRYQARYGSRPTRLPVTLDEWSWLSEFRWYAAAVVHGHALLEPVTHYQGAALVLVEHVEDRPDGSIAVRI